jgi:hypothetical protein
VLWLPFISTTVLDLFVLADDCLHCLLACCRLANPHLPTSDVGLPPCPTDAPQCSCCNGNLASQFPKLLKAGVQTLGNSLIRAIRQHPLSNNLMFGWSASNKPEPRHLKKVALMLVAAKILGFRIHFSDDDQEKKHPIVVARLLKNDLTNGLALHSDEHWTKIRLHQCIRQLG